MASSIVTADGKDLDSRYLGINAKAKSATTADSATKATNADNANYANSAGISNITVVTLTPVLGGEIGRTWGFTTPNSNKSWLVIAISPKSQELGSGDRADIAHVLGVYEKNTFIRTTVASNTDSSVRRGTCIAIRLS